MQQCQNHIPFAISAIFALVVKAVEGGNSQISLWKYLAMGYHYDQKKI